MNNIFVKVSVQTVLETFFNNRPVNRVLNVGFLSGKPKDEAFAIFRPHVHFKFLNLANNGFFIKNENECELRIHSNDLISHIQKDIIPLNKYDTESFTFVYNGEEVLVNVKYDVSAWFTITSPHLNKIAERALELSKE